MVRFGNGTARARHSSCSPGPSTRVKTERDTETAQTRDNGAQPMAAFVLTRDGQYRLHKSNNMESHAAMKLLSSAFMNVCRTTPQRSEARRSLTYPGLAAASDHQMTRDDDILDVTHDAQRSIYEENPGSSWRGRPTWRFNRGHSPSTDFYDEGAPNHDIRDDLSMQDEPLSNNAMAIPPDSASQHFSITEPEKVKAYLYNRFEKLQQLSAKRVAKAWIKGICPRKQANFPYQHKQREEESGGPDIPKWWPDQSICPWKEPDHVRKEERNELLVHILRLRPSTEELQIMNHNRCGPSEHQVFETWTAFLRSLAPPSSCYDLKPFDKVAAKKRNDLLRDIYDVAEKEENFLDGNGPASTIYWRDEQAAKLAQRKIKRRAVSVASSNGTEAKMSTSRQSSMNRGRRVMKRRRCRSVVPSPALVPHRQSRQSSLVPVKEQTVSEKDSLSPVANTAMLVDDATAQARFAALDIKPIIQQHATPLPITQPGPVYRTAASWRAAHYPPPKEDWQSMIASPNTSFSSSTMAREPTMGVQAVDNDMPEHIGHHGYQYARHQSQQAPAQPQALQVYHAQHIPQPQFDTVPSTPIDPQNGLMWPAYETPVAAQCMDTPMTDSTLAHAQDLGPQTPALTFQPGFLDLSQPPHGLATYFAPPQRPAQLIAPSELHQHVNNMHGLPDPTYAHPGHFVTMPASPYPPVHDHHITAPQYPPDAHLERLFTGYGSGVGGGQPT